MARAFTPTRKAIPWLILAIWPILAEFRLSAALRTSTELLLEQKALVYEMMCSEIHL